jgi:hypothetical protein
VILDGIFGVRVGGSVAGSVAPGGTVGERDALERLEGTPDVVATSEARIALVTGDDADAEALGEQTEASCDVTADTRARQRASPWLVQRFVGL